MGAVKEKCNVVGKWLSSGTYLVGWLSASEPGGLVGIIIDQILLVSFPFFPLPLVRNALRVMPGAATTVIRLFVPGASLPQ